MTAGPARVVVTGASGNVGAGVLRALALHLPDTEVVGVCRRPPTVGRIYERVCWHSVDLASRDAAAQLAPAMRRADVVIHLALAVRPDRDDDYLYRANVLGTQAVLKAMTTAGVRQLVYASSLGIYAPGATAPVSEGWPDTGQETSTYSRHKVIVDGYSTSSSSRIRIRRWRFGRVDVAAQCAAITAFGRFEDLPVDVFDEVVRTNLLGSANVARSALTHFQANGTGHLVLVGSLLGTAAAPYQSAYVVSKFALNGMVRLLRQEIVTMRASGPRGVSGRPSSRRSSGPPTGSVRANAKSAG